MNENKYDHFFMYYAAKHNLDWLFLKAQVKQESRFNPDAVSPVGAVGLAQFMRATWEEWKDGTPGIQAADMLFDRRNPEHAIRAQAAYMNWCINRVHKYTHQNVEKYALMIYNYGTRPLKWLKQGLDYQQIYTMVPTETKIYVAKVMCYYNEYVSALPSPPWRGTEGVGNA